MPLSSKMRVSVAATLTNQLDLGEANAPLNQTYLKTLASGVLAGQSDLIFHDRRALGPSANEDLDLAGVLAGPLGGVLTFVRIKGIVVASVDANLNNITVGAAASNAWATLLNATGTVTLRPGGVWAAFCGEADSVGWAVTAGTGDLLRVTNAAGVNTINYDVIVIGASA